jgi:gamma-glutamyl-gamma-aminobutyrate hydrolase PuuD
MNPELLKNIVSYKLNITTSKNTIKVFLNTCIATSLYSEISGETIEEKVETIYNYLHGITKEPKVKQILNIVIADDASSLDYVSYLNEKFDVIVHKTNDVTNPKDIDLVLFTGGEDVNPQYYGEQIGKYTGMNSNRDKKEIDTFHKFRNHSLLLGICRGSQLMTVLSNGKLIQHVEGHGRDHSMVVNGSLKYQITSSHHQMLYPFDLNKKDYELIAYSEYFQSNTYLNGDNEEIELPKNFLEPEIVYYKNTNALCIQGHPEWGHCEKRTSNMCLNLIDKYLKAFKEDKKSINPNYYKTISITDVNEFEHIDEDEDHNYDFVEEENELN